MIQLFEMIFNVTPDCRRNLHVPAGVFKSHQSFPSPLTSLKQEQQTGAEIPERTRAELLLLTAPAARAPIFGQANASIIIAKLDSRRASRGYTTARRSRDPGICI